MRKLLFFLSLLLNVVLLLSTYYYFRISERQLSYFDFSKYTQSNQDFIAGGKQTDSLICFVGNSVTENWIHLRPDFFFANSFANRGAGGQTSTQILLRFQQDVIALEPSIVVLSVGINDIGEGDRFYDMNYTLSNIESIIDLCKANNITPVLTNLLPTSYLKKDRYRWVRNTEQKVEELNKEIVKLADRKQLVWIDYHSLLKNDANKFDSRYTDDNIHPNAEGYKIMEAAVILALNRFKNN